MRFQILHESRGRVRLRAVQRTMSMREADLLEAWIRVLPGVDQVTVHERICGVTILFSGERPEKRRMYSAPTAARSTGRTRKSWFFRCCGTMGKSSFCPCRSAG